MKIHIAKFLTDVKTVGAALLLLISVAAWAADTRYMTKDGYVQSEEKSQVQSLRREISDLEIRQKFSSTRKDKRMFQALIDIKENQIKIIKGE